MGAFRTLDDLDVEGKTVLVRVDFNVPMKDGRVGDATRIDRSLPTIEQLLERDARVVLLSHLGRPKGQRVPEMTLEPVAGVLAKRLPGRGVVFAGDCIGPEAETLVAGLDAGEIALLENLRFHPGEEANDQDFATALARLGDCYIDDAFSAAHRAHASVEAIAHLLPAAAGRLMQAELESLSAALDRPERPVAAIIGGAKISTKLDLLGNLLDKVDLLVVGGGMANTFLYAKGLQVGASLCERDMGETARGLLERARTAKCRVVLPSDVVIAPDLAPGVECETVPVDAVPSDQKILDIGPQTAQAIGQRLADCRTLVWNGPLGCFEVPPFDAGTNAVAQKAARLTRAGHCFSVAGGGDTLAALAHAGVSEDFSYLSTAGGAFLEWLEGRVLPGVKALEDAAH